MEIPVLLERLKNNGFRATSLLPPPIVTEAATRDEALKQLLDLLHGRLSNAELVQLPVKIPGESHPWKSLAATWKNHPDASELEKSIEEYRRQVDADPERQ